MARNVLETQILLRYGTYTQWMSSSVILGVGEAAICSFPDDRAIDQLSTTTPEHTPPAVGIKIGDGRHYFYELPWVQAVAADVYNWAKTQNKPTYTASEITGLESFIEEHFNISGDITIAPRIYQIIQGTDEDANKYYLRYKENNEESQWIVDTNNPIDLTLYARIAAWIGTLLDRYPTIGTFTLNQTNNLINNLSYTDNPVSNTFVTSVSEVAGVISVERAQPTFANINGIASVSQGGTGRTSLTSNSVLVGNGENAVSLVPIADVIAANNYLVPNYLIKSYVDNAVAGINKAMHFIGEATVAITGPVDPRITGYTFANAQPGDVILWDSKEYVWDGGNWVLLGDEGSYAVKGSIKDADIAEDANISQSKIVNLTTDLSSKVDKIDGKSLSTNDYTTEEKEKLEGIESGAQRNIIEHIYVNDVEQVPSIVNGQSKSIALSIQSFDETRAQKLDAIEYGANVNKIEHIFVNDTEITPSVIRGQNKSVNIQFNEFTSNEKNKLANIEANAQVNKVEQITLNGATYYPDNSKNINMTITSASLGIDMNNIVAQRVQHKLTFGESGVYQYDGSTDVTVPVYTGGVF